MLIMMSDLVSGGAASTRHLPSNVFFIRDAASDSAAVSSAGGNDLTVGSMNTE